MTNAGVSRCSFWSHSFANAKRLDTIEVYTTTWPGGDRSRYPTSTVYVYEETCTRCKKHRVRKNRVRA